MRGGPFLWRGAAVGAILGAAATLVLWVADLTLANGGFGPWQLVAIHLGNPIHWVTDLLPFGLAWAGWAIESLSTVRASGYPSIHDPWADTRLSERLLDAAFLVDPDGRVIEANRSAERIFGYGTGEFRGVALRDFLPDHDDQEHTRSQEVQSPSMEVLGVRWEMRAMRADGVTFEALVTISPTTHRRFVYMVRSRAGRVSHDAPVPESWIVERKNLVAERDAALDTNMAKSAFLANMSHELRTPLNAIIGYSELLTEELADEGIDLGLGDLQKVSSSAKHLLSLLNSILDLSKIEAGRMSVILEPIPVAELVRDVKTNIDPLAAKNGNELVVKVGNVSVVRGDPMQLRQVLINLLGNACKFTENGTIELEVAGDPKSDFYVAFHVRDTGIGMSEAQVERLFQEYVQADRSIQAKYGGTGLGLTISKRFIEMMGGELKATSTLGKGSVFTVLVPSGYHSATDVPNFTMPVSGGRTIIPDFSAQTDVRRLLYIDGDDEALQQIVVRRLESAGYVVEVCSECSSALERAVAARPHAILIDVAMPDGWATLERLTSDEHLQGVAVIVASAEDDPERAFGLGAAASLTKPIDHDRLVESLRHAAESALVVLFEPDATVASRLCKSMRTLGWRVTDHRTGSDALEALGRAGRAVVVIDAAASTEEGEALLSNILDVRALHGTPVVWVGAYCDALGDHLHCRVEGLDSKALPEAVANAATRAFAIRDA